MPLIDQEGLNIIRALTSGIESVQATDPSITIESLGLDSDDSGSGMPDRCKIGAWTKTGYDDMNQPTFDYVYGSEIPCRFHLIAASQQQEVAGNTQVETSDATCHLPLDQVVNKKDRVQLTKKWNLPVIPQDYEITGAFVVNASDITIHLRLVTNQVGT